MSALDFSGRTALVTGASAGIGRELARLLAKDVGTLVVVARREDRLQELAKELTSARSDLRVLVRAVDLLDRKATGEMLDGLEREGVNIDVLINNAGFGDFGMFEKSGWTKLEQLLELNVVTTTFLLHRLIPGMVGRGFGAILDVGSSAGMLAQPGFGTYAASKAYVNLLGEALSAELEGTGVSVTTLCPGPVPTEFQEVAGSEGTNPLPKAFRITAEQCAKEGIEALKARTPRLIPGAPMRTVVVALESVPRSVVRPFLNRMAKKVRGR